jgi:tRNA-Thr(GGU) m(6)t(6)A37 methyltransferase TsaA
VTWVPDMTGNDLGSEAPVLQLIGRVESSLTDPATAPKQADASAPPAWLALDPRVREGLRDVAVGDELLVITWLHRADRNTLSVHPQDRTELPLRGVFSTRSADRPNPLGVHPVRVIGREVDRIQVDRLEAVDETPVVDIKPVI